MSKTGVVATYGGEQFGTVTIYMDGFWDGVQYYNAHFPAKYTGTLANDGVALAPYHSFNSLIPAALRSALKTVKAKIESGKIVPATKGQF